MMKNHVVVRIHEIFRLRRTKIMFTDWILLPKQTFFMKFQAQKNLEKRDVTGAGRYPQEP